MTVDRGEEVESALEGLETKLLERLRLHRELLRGSGSRHGAGHPPITQFPRALARSSALSPPLPSQPSSSGCFVRRSFSYLMPCACAGTVLCILFGFG
ncbi:hypothetical protein BHE74_00036603 [Ensete ventricosum]|nr:hypothetical protein BHE74_00036603 [Ensete ventricosum]